MNLRILSHLGQIVTELFMTSVENLASEEIHKEIEFFVFVNLLRLMLLLIGTLTFCYEVTSSSVVANRVTGQQKGTAGHSL